MASNERRFVVAYALWRGKRMQKRFGHKYGPDGAVAFQHQKEQEWYATILTDTIDNDLKTM